MARARRQLLEALPRVDAILEVADARAPRSSRHPELPELARGKPRVVLFAKEDLADPQVSRQWLQWVRAQGERALLANLREGGWIARTVRLLRSAARTRRRAATLRTMVVGIPNVGKSTAINALAGRAKAGTGARAGVTRRVQWLAAGEGLELLDSPGLLWPEATRGQKALYLAVAGLVPDDAFDVREAAAAFLTEMGQRYRDRLAARYGEDCTGAGEAMLAAVARRMGLWLPGGKPDLDRAAVAVLQDFRTGRLGRLTLELPPEA